MVPLPVLPEMHLSSLASSHGRQAPAAAAAAPRRARERGLPATVGRTRRAPRQTARKGPSSLHAERELRSRGEASPLPPRQAEEPGPRPLASPRASDTVGAIRQAQAGCVSPLVPGTPPPPKRKPRVCGTKDIFQGALKGVYFGSSRVSSRQFAKLMTIAARWLFEEIPVSSQERLGFWDLCGAAGPGSGGSRGPEAQN